QIAIDANSFYPADWAKQKGLYTQVYDSTEALDESVKATAEDLRTYNPDAIRGMNAIVWKGTEDWDTLLAERGATSATLGASEFTKEKLKTYKELVSRE